MSIGKQIEKPKCESILNVVAKASELNDVGRCLKQEDARSRVQRRWDEKTMREYCNKLVSCKLPADSAWGDLLDEIACIREYLLVHNMQVSSNLIDGHCCRVSLCTSGRHLTVFTKRLVYETCIFLWTCVSYY